jgi:hypothetical protein
MDQTPSILEVQDQKKKFPLFFWSQFSFFFFLVLLCYPGVYGTKGIGTTSTTPSARHGASSWTDSDGNLWLFGGNNSTGKSLSSFYFVLFLFRIVVY